MPQQPPLAQRYVPHIEDICAGIATAALFRPLFAPLFALVALRLRRFVVRLRRLAERWQQGRLRPPRKRAATPRTPAAVLRTPRGHAWLIRLHQPLAQFAPRIELILNDPEIQALCEAAPQARRLLRPLIRMFGLDRPAIPAPPKPRTPPPRTQPPVFPEHSPSQWPFVPLRLRLRVPGLVSRKPPD